MPVRPSPPVEFTERLAYQQVLQRRNPVHRGHAGVAHEARERIVHAEQPHQAVSGSPHHRNRLGPTALVSSQEHRIADVPKRLRARTSSSNDATSCRPRFQALARKRMHDVRRIAYQRDPVSDQAVDDDESQRKVWDTPAVVSSPARRPCVL